MVREISPTIRLRKPLPGLPPVPEVLPSQSDECDPSQNGALPECLHWQRKAFPSFSAVKGFGANPVPLCEPSHQG